MEKVIPLAQVAQLPVIYPKEVIRGMSKDLCVEMFITALFRISMDVHVQPQVKFKLIWDQGTAMQWHISDH